MKKKVMLLWFGKKRLYIALFLFLLCSSIVAQGGKEYFANPIQHRAGFYVDNAFGHSIPIGIQNVHDFRARCGYQADLGFLYEYNNKHFLFDIGIGIGFHSNRYELLDSIITNTTIEDTQGKPFKLHVGMTKKDKMRIGHIEIPILAGYTNKRFFMLGGMKFDFKVLDASKTTGRLNLYGEYSAYISSFHYMPNHGFRRGLYSYKSEAVFTAKAYLTFEGGYNFREFSTKKRYTAIPKLSFFVNVGSYLPFVEESEKIAYTEENANMYEISSYGYESILAKGKRPLLDAQVGLKFVLLFTNNRKNTSGCITCKQQQLQKQPYCPMCEKQHKDYMRRTNKKEKYNHSWAE